MSDINKLRLLICVIILAGSLSFSFFTWLLFKLKLWILVWFGGYIVIYHFTRWLHTKWNNNVMEATSRIVTIPVDFFFFLVVIAKPFITIFGTFLYIFLYAFCVPALLFKFLSYLGWLTIKEETIAFIVIALGSILCSHSYKFTKWLIHQTPLQDRGNHIYESYSESMAVYLIHPSNVIFFLYVVYFVLLGVSGFLQIEYNSYLFSGTLDEAMLKAFLVFVAFTNMRAKAEETKVEARELLQRTLKLFTHDKFE